MATSPTSPTDWGHFNIAKLFDKTELDKAYKQCMPAQHSEVNKPSTSQDPVDGWTSPSSQLTSLLAANSIQNPARFLNPNLVLPASSSLSTIVNKSNSANPASVTQDGHLDIHQFSGVFDWRPEDRQALLESIRKSIASSTRSKTPTALQKRVAVIRQIHEALPDLNAGVMLPQTSPLLDSSASHIVSEKTSSLPSAIQLGLNAFMTIREHLDLCEPRLCRGLVETLRPLFAQAAMKKIDMASGDSILAATSAFLTHAAINQDLDQDTRDHACEILVQLSAGQASVAGMVSVVRLLLLNSAHIGDLHLSSTMAFLAEVIQNASSTNIAPELYSFGRGDTGRLGQGPSASTSTSPQLIEGLQGKNAVSVSTFSTHSLAITNSGDVYAWGNGQHGRLGTKSLANAPSPILLKTIPGHRIIGVAVGLSHSVLLSDQGKVFTFGNGVNGRLGTGDTKERRTPTLIQSLTQQEVTGIACGSAFTFALCKGGALFSWGKNTAGQCGHANLSECQTPKRIAALGGEVVVDVAGGWDHALACTASGAAFSWGCGYEGTRPVLGHGSKARLHTPALIEKLRGNHVVKVAAGYDHSIAVCTTGEVFSWGSSAVGQLGLGDTQERLYPEKVKTLAEHFIVSADGGMDHTLFITRGGEVLACGNGAESALGVSCPGPQLTPVLIENLRGKYIMKVACGDKCSIVLSRIWQHQTSATSTGPLKAEKVVRCPGLSVPVEGDNLNESKPTVSWEQAVVHCMGAMDVSSASFAPNGISLWSESSFRPVNPVERFAIGLKKSTFEHLADILECLQNTSLLDLSKLSGMTKHAQSSPVSEGLSSVDVQPLNAVDIFLPYLIVSVLRVLKSNIWQAVRISSDLSALGLAEPNAEIAHRLYSHITELMVKNHAPNFATEWCSCLRQEAAEVFVLGIELWFPSQHLRLELLSQLLNNEMCLRFPDVMPFGVSIQDAVMKRLSEPSLLQSFIQDTGFGHALLPILQTLVCSVHKGPSVHQDEIVVHPFSPSDRKDSGTGTDSRFLDWARSPITRFQKATELPAAATASVSSQRGDVALLLAFQQALLNQAYAVHCGLQNMGTYSSPTVSQRNLIAYSTDLILRCSSILETSEHCDNISNSIVHSVLPTLITTLECFTDSVFLSCALLKSVRGLLQNLEMVQSQFPSLSDCGWILDLLTTAGDICGRFLMTIISSPVPTPKQLSQERELSEFIKDNIDNADGSTTIRTAALQFIGDLLHGVTTFFALDAILTCIVDGVLSIKINSDDIVTLGAMMNIIRLVMDLHRRSNLNLLQKNAIIMRTLPIIAADFIIDNEKIRDELGVLPFLRNCISKIQYCSNRTSEHVTLFQDIHYLALRLFQCVMLEKPDLFASIANALHEELAAACSWPQHVELASQTGSSPVVAAFVTLIGPSLSLSSTPVELSNVCQADVLDVSFSLWLWVSSGSPSLYLKFSGHSAFLHVTELKVHFEFNNIVLQHEAPLDSGHWALITVSIKNRQVRLYIDDSLSGQQTSVSNLTPFPTNVPIFASGHVESRICDFRWWPIPLTLEQVCDLHNHGPHSMMEDTGPCSSDGVSPVLTPYEISSFEYLCTLNCFIRMFPENPISSMISWMPVLVPLIQKSPVVVRLVSLRTVDHLLRDSDLISFEPLLWSLIQYNSGVDKAVASGDDFAVISQEAVLLYQRLLSRPFVKKTFIERLKSMSSLLPEHGADGDVMRALSVLGGGLQEVRIGSEVRMQSGFVGLVTALDKTSGLCAIVLDNGFDNTLLLSSSKRLTRLQWRQELASKCCPIFRVPCFQWCSDFLLGLAPIIVASSDKVSKIVGQELSPVSNWAAASSQAMRCVLNSFEWALAARSTGTDASWFIDVVSSSGTISAVVKTALCVLPASIQKQFRSVLEIEAQARLYMNRDGGTDKGSSVIGSGRRGIIPIQIVSSLECLGLVSSRQSTNPSVPVPDPFSSVYKCPACSQRDMTMPTFLVHFEKQHGKSRIRAECPLCSASSRSIPGTVHPSLSEHFNRCHQALAANGAEVPTSSVSQDSVVKLMAMGFEVEHCIYALEQNHEDLIAATNWILNNLSTVASLVEAKKAASVDQNAATNTATSVVDENNTFELARKQADIDAAANTDFLELECGIEQDGAADHCKAPADNDNSIANINNTLCELAVVRARIVVTLWMHLKQTIDINASDYLKLLKLTHFRGNMSIDMGFKHIDHIGFQLSQGADSSCLAEVLMNEVIQQLAIATSSSEACIYEEVNWGSRIEDCTDVLALDDRFLNFERTESIVRAGLVDKVLKNASELLLACLKMANAHVKVFALSLLSMPNASNIPVPVDQLCTLLSRRVLREQSLHRITYSPFTKALFQTCVSRLTLRPSKRDISESGETAPISFSGLSPLSVSEDCIKVTSPIDGAWLGAVASQCFVMWSGPDIKPSDNARSTASWAFDIDQMTKGMICLGITAEPEADSCAWLGSSSTSWGMFGDGSVWHNGRRISKFDKGFDVKDVVSFTLDLQYGTVTAKRNGVRFGQIIRGVRGTVYPAVAMFYQNNSVTLRNRWDTLVSPAPPSDVETLYKSLSRASRISSAISSTARFPEDDVTMVYEWYEMWVNRKCCPYKATDGSWNWFSTNPIPFSASTLKYRSRIKTALGTGIFVGSLENTIWVHIDGEEGARPITAQQVDEDLGPSISTEINQANADSVFTYDRFKASLESVSFTAIRQFYILVQQSTKLNGKDPSYLTVEDIIKINNGEARPTSLIIYSLLNYINRVVDDIIAFAAYPEYCHDAVLPLVNLIWFPTKVKVWKEYMCAPESSYFYRSSDPKVATLSFDRTQPYFAQFCSQIQTIPPSSWKLVTSTTSFTVSPLQSEHTPNSLEKRNSRSFNVHWANQMSSNDQNESFRDVICQCIVDIEKNQLLKQERSDRDLTESDSKIFRSIGVLLGMALRCQIYAKLYMADNVWDDIFSGSVSAATSVGAISNGIRAVIPIDTLPLFTCEDLKVLIRAFDESIRGLENCATESVAKFGNPERFLFPVRLFVLPGRYMDRQVEDELLRNRASVLEYIHSLKFTNDDDLRLLKILSRLALLFPHLSSEICSQLPSNIDYSAPGISSVLCDLLTSGLPLSSLLPLCDRSALLSLTRSDPDARRALVLSLSPSIPVPSPLYDPYLWRHVPDQTHIDLSTPIPATLAPIDHMITAFQSLHMAHITSIPIMVIGPASSGKSAIIDAFTSTLSRKPMRLFLDEGTDLKSLVGTYNCTDVAGELAWVPGPITCAIQSDVDIILEDIDRIPVDLLHSLRSLFECRQLLVPELGQYVTAKPAFRIYATCSADVELPVDSLFCKVKLAPLSIGHCGDIVNTRFPSLSPHIDLIMQTYTLALKFNPTVTLRSLLRFAHRIALLPLPSRLTSHVRERVVEYCHVAFVGNMPPSTIRTELSDSIALLWDVDIGRNHYLLYESIPSCTTELSSLAPTVSARRLLSRLAVSIEHNECVLLVGETGIGKTAIIEELAQQRKAKLVVINLSQQSEAQELIGGYKPVDLRSAAIPLLNSFASLFPKTFSRASNVPFLESVRRSFDQHRASALVTLLSSCVDRALSKELSSKLQKSWIQFQASLHIYRNQVRRHDRGAFSFWFVEGELVRAVRDGNWVLLDEINLATPDTLHCLSALLEHPDSSITLIDNGNVEVARHSSFRLLACMNPPTDSCRRPLHPSFRARFTEIYVDDISDPADLVTIVRYSLPSLPSSIDPSKIVTLYLHARDLSSKHMLTSAEGSESGDRPHYSLRALCRALRYASSSSQKIGIHRALYEGLVLSFMTPLDVRSRSLLSASVDDVVPPKILQIKAQTIPDPSTVTICGFHITRGPNPIVDLSEDEFIVTPTVEGRLRDLARAVSGKTPLPVLLQGPTSAGKTSIVEYLARRTGNTLVRINNHEHTDTSEYLGSYTTDPSTGLFTFAEGELVRAVRNGYWLVLDELNLAPSEVLEALNRLLDDHRQLHIPETQETVQAHPSFALFATQNPAGGAYGGRKLLSRAFRNRFIEIHVGDMPTDELVELLHRRGRLAPSHCRKMIDVMIDLQKRRQLSGVFSGKSGLITARDLFRWARRCPITIDDIASFGYMLLADRLRSEPDRLAVAESLASNLKVNALVPSQIYEAHLPANYQSAPGLAMTSMMKRIMALSNAALQAMEPVLLVGDTGLGKTTLCQALADLSNQTLQIINVHQHTDTADIIGSLRPVRGRAALIEAARHALHSAGLSLTTTATISSDIIDRIPDGPLAEQARDAVRKANALFEWVDGPLITAMRQGHWILIDEIALADDAVVERLNSVLEHGRSILLAEKAGDGEVVVAAKSFRILATMNPSGDFGKKELSPALRNRFTEIWVPSDHSVDDLSHIISVSIQVPQLQPYGRCLMHLFNSYHEQHCTSNRERLSLRDIRSFIAFMSHAVTSCKMSNAMAFLHAALLTLIDGLGLGSGCLSADRKRNVFRLAIQVLGEDDQICVSEYVDMDNCFIRTHQELRLENKRFGVDPFWACCGDDTVEAGRSQPTFDMSTPTTNRNVIRVLRGLQLPKAILLEGSPGVGKTSLISSLGKLMSHRVIRLNLSEQTDMMDLLGSDFPVADTPGQFQWCDGPFLDAIINGYWVLLDELNLASQSVLEGLNAVLDHRATIYIPDLSREFVCHPSFRVFACQNPVHEGGGRKSLPASFLNRFTKVHLEDMSRSDFETIIMNQFPEADLQMLEFNQRLHQAVLVENRFASKGSPWEFNLRDVFRWCISSGNAPESGFDIAYRQRLRTPEDRQHAVDLFAETFQGRTPTIITHPRIHISPSSVTIADHRTPYSQRHLSTSYFSSKTGRDLLFLQGMAAPIMHMTECVNRKYPVILVGPSFSGKTSAVRYMAQLYKQTLLELPINTALDATELLGAFEQVNVSRYRNEIVALLENEIRSSCYTGKITAETLNLWGAVELRQQSDCTIDEIPLLHRLNSMLGLPLFEKISALNQLLENGCIGRFEWVDGMLLSAVVNGYWLLLDNANLCSSSILDRLNSLLEPNGTILVNESGAARSIVPHVDFRLFMTANEQYGMLSRAIRNRCVEISLVPDAPVAPSLRWRHRYTNDDIINILVNIGITDPHLAAFCLETHSSLADGNICEARLQQLLQFADLASQQARRGIAPASALVSALKQAYSVPHDVVASAQSRLQVLLNDQDRSVHGAWPGLPLMHSNDIVAGRVNRILGLHKFLLSNPDLTSCWSSHWIPRNLDINNNMSLVVALEFATLADIECLQHEVSEVHALIQEEMPRHEVWEAFLAYWRKLPESTQFLMADPKTRFGELGSQVMLLATRFFRNCASKGAQCPLSVLPSFLLGDDHPAISLIPQTLKHIDETLLSAPYSDNVVQCWRLRDRLHDSLSISAPSSDEYFAALYIRLRSLQKALSADASHVHILLDKLAGSCCQGSGHKVSNRLWKHSGHPVLPSTIQLAKLRSLMLKLDRTSNALGHVPRRTLTEAFSTCYNHTDDELLTNVENTINVLQQLTSSSEILPKVDAFTIRITGADHDEGDGYDEVIEISYIPSEFEIREFAAPLARSCVESVERAILDGSVPIHDLQRVSEFALSIACQHIGSLRSCHSLEPLQTLSWTGSLSVHLLHRLQRVHFMSRIDQQRLPTSVIFDSVVQLSKTALRRRLLIISSLKRMLSVHWRCNSGLFTIETGLCSNNTEVVSLVHQTFQQFFPELQISDDLDTLYRYILQLNDHRLNQVTSWFLAPLMQLLHNDVCFTPMFLLSCLRLHLMVPAVCLDPVLKHKTRAHDLGTSLAEIRNEIDIRSATSELITGYANVNAQLKQQEQTLEEQYLRSHASITSRPGSCSFKTVYDLIHAFVSTHASSSRVLNLISNPPIEECQQWIDNAKCFLQNIDDAIYYAYEDIVSPVMLEVLRMIVSLQDYISSKYQAVHDHRITAVMAALSLDGPECLRLTQLSILDNTISENLAVPLIKIILSRLSAPLLEQERSSTLSRTMRTIAYVWKAHHLKQQNEAEAQGSLYKSKAGSGGMAAESCEEQRRHLEQTMFPSFIKDFSDLLNDCDSNPFSEDNSDDQLTSPENCTTNSVQFSDEDLAQIYTLFTTAVGGTPLQSSCLSENDIAKTVHRSVLQLSPESSFDVNLEQDSRCSFGAAELLARQLSYLSSSTSSPSSSVGDIYREPALDELQDLETSVRDLLTRVQVVLSVDECRGHPTLVTLARICSRLASMPISSPLMRIVSAVEQILAQAEKWESYAAKFVSLAEQIKPLSGLIARWRKMELEAWPYALLAIDHGAHARALRLWPHLLQLFISDDSRSDLSQDDLFVALDEFVQTSTFGEFTVRLHILSSLSLIADNRYKHVLNNLVVFYTPLHSICVSQCQNERKVIEKKLQDLTRLARWDLANWHALKASCERSHRKLTGFVQSWDEVLRTPVRQLIAKHHQQYDSPEKPITVAHFSDSEVESLSSFSSLIISDNVSLKMVALMEPILPSSLELCQDVRSTSESILHRCESLRSQNAPVLRKKKALTDAMHIFKGYGLSFHAIAARESCPGIDTTSLSMVLDSAGLRNSESSFFDVVEIMRSLRAGIHTHSGDLSSTEAKRCLGLQEHIFSLIVAERRSLSHVDHIIMQVEAWSNAVTDAANIDRSIIDLRKAGCLLAESVTALKRASSCYSSLGSSLTGEESVSAHESHASCSLLVSEIDPILSQLTSVFEQFAVMGVAMRPTHSVIAVADSSISTLTRISELLPKLPFASSFMRLRDDIKLFLSKPEMLPMTDYSISAECVTEQVKLLVQRVRSAGSNEVHPESLIEHHHLYLNMCSAFNSDRLIDCLRLMAWDDTCAVRDQLSVLLKAMKMLRFSVNCFYFALIGLARTTGTVLNSLFRVGFCKPAARDAEDNECDEEAADGTGMGEGTGAKDVSNELEDEEQILGLKQDKQEGPDNDEKPENVDRDEDGMEMENDFDGTMHDVNRDEEPERDDEDPEDEETPPLDKEMGDIDRENENVVDERLWDDKIDKEEEGTDKQNEQTEKDAEISGRPDEVDIAAKENDQSDSEENEQKSQDSQPKDRDDKQKVDKDDKNTFDEMEEEPENENYNCLPDDERFEDNQGIDLQLPEEINLDDNEDGGEDKIDEYASGSDEGDMDDGEDFDCDDQSETGPNSEDGVDGEMPPPCADAEDMVHEPGHDVEEAEVAGQVEENLDQENDEAEKDGIENNNHDIASAEAISVDIPERKGNSDSIDGDDSGGNGADDDGKQGQNTVGNANESNADVRPMQPQFEDEAQAHKQKPANQQNNPLRSIADAQQHWQRRLEILEQTQQNSETIEEGRDQLGDLVEHVNDDMECDGEAVAPVTTAVDGGVEEKDDDDDAHEPNLVEDDAVPTENPADNDHPEKTPESDKFSPSNRRSQREQRKSMPAHEPVVDCPPVLNDMAAMDIDDALLPNSSVAMTTQDTASCEVDIADAAIDNMPSIVQTVSVDTESVNELQWAELSSATSDLSSALCEQLRIILQPQIASSLGGAFRTGKRLSIRRLIAYIASSYRQDRIWLRRCRLTKRAYDIGIAIDDSLSMRDAGAGKLALQAMATLANAITRLDSGNLSVLKFGETATVLSSSFSNSAGPDVLSKFKFDQTSTKFADVLELGLCLFDDARQSTMASFSNNQLMFIISDARVQQDRPDIARQLRRAAANGQFIVLLIIDSAPDGPNSILNMKMVSYPNNKLQIVDYLQDFPFPYYIILRKAADLPAVVADALRQWIEHVNRKSASTIQ